MDYSGLPYIIGIVLAGFVCFYFAHRQLYYSYLIADLPLSKINGIFVGLVSIEGTAETCQPAAAPFSQTPCVLLDWSVSEGWERWETETYRDSQNQLKTRKVLRKGSDTISSGTYHPDHFYLKDETGIVRICHSKAKMENRLFFTKEVTQASDPQLYHSVAGQYVKGSTGVRTFRESGILLHDHLYVIGNALCSDSEALIEIRDDANSATPYMISYSQPTQNAQNCGCLYSGLLFISLTIWLFLLYCAADGFKNQMILIWGASGVFFLTFLSWLYIRYLTMVDLRNKVKQALSNVDVQLQRRASLIPPLEGCVRGAATHERTLLKLLVNLRKRAARRTKRIYGCLPVVNLLAERYPQISANANFNALRLELANTEQKIALARQYCNDVTEQFNTRITRIPECFIAQAAGLKKMDFLEISDIEQVVPNIPLAN